MYWARSVQSFKKGLLVWLWSGPLEIRFLASPLACLWFFPLLRYTPLTYRKAMQSVLPWSMAACCHYFNMQWFKDWELPFPLLSLSGTTSESVQISSFSGFGRPEPQTLKYKLRDFGRTCQGWHTPSEEVLPDNRYSGRKSPLKQWCPKWVPWGGAKSAARFISVIRCTHMITFHHINNTTHFSVTSFLAAEISSCKYSSEELVIRFSPQRSVRRSVWADQRK